MHVAIGTFVAVALWTATAAAQGASTVLCYDTGDYEDVVTAVYCNACVPQSNPDEIKKARYEIYVCEDGSLLYLLTNTWTECGYVARCTHE